MKSRAPVYSSFVLAALLLTGCAPATGEGVSAATPAASPTMEATREPIVGEPGDPLTAAEAKQLNSQRGTLRPYEKNDGSYVVIDVKQPLPPEVKQEVAESLGSVGNDTGSALGQLDRETSTGKTIIMVRQIHYSSATGGSFFGWHAVSYASGFPMGVTGGSSDAVVSQIQPWVNSQRDPGQYEIIVVNN